MLWQKNKELNSIYVWRIHAQAKSILKLLPKYVKLIHINALSGTGKILFSSLLSIREKLLNSSRNIGKTWITSHYTFGASWCPWLIFTRQEICYFLLIKWMSSTLLIQLKKFGSILTITHGHITVSRIYSHSLSYKEILPLIMKSYSITR